MKPGRVPSSARNRWTAAVVLCAAWTVSSSVHADPETDAMLDGILGDEGGSAAAPAPKARAKPERRKKARGKRKHGKDDDVDMVFEDPGPAEPPAAAEGSGAPARPADSGVRKVVVVDFDAPEQIRVRPTVLEVLSLQSDIEVLGYNDVTIVAHRLSADPMTPRGRIAISEELGIFAWLDGRISDDFEAYLRLTNPGGRELAWLKVRGQSRGTLNDAIKQHLWRAIGPELSDAEKRRQALEARRKIGAQKKEARDQEVMRQRELAARRRERMAERLAAAKSLAKDKAKARNAELDRQAQLVAERRAAEEKEHQEQLAAERQRQLEMEKEQARQDALARQQQQPSYGGDPGWGAPPPAAGGGYGDAGYGGQQASAAPDPGAPGGVSPAMQEWLERRRRGGASPGGAAPAPSTAPEPPGGVSPETRAWLEQHRGQ